jgi:hypothetical protein
MIYDELKINPDKILLKMIFNSEELDFTCYYLRKF